MTLTGHHPRVLVIQDEQEVRRAFKQALERSGYAVSTAEDAETALEVALRARPELIVISLPAPPLDVVNSAIAIRAQGGLGEKVPLVILPAVRTEIEAADIPLGHEVYVSFLSGFEQLENLLRGLLARARPSLC